MSDWIPMVVRICVIAFYASVICVLLAKAVGMVDDYIRKGEVTDAKSGRLDSLAGSYLLLVAIFAIALLCTVEGL